MADFIALMSHPAAIVSFSVVGLVLLWGIGEIIVDEVRVNARKSYLVDETIRRVQREGSEIVRERAEAALRGSNTPGALDDALKTQEKLAEVADRLSEIVERTVARTSGATASVEVGTGDPRPGKVNPAAFDWATDDPSLDASPPVIEVEKKRRGSRRNAARDREAERGGEEAASAPAPEEERSTVKE